MEKCVSKLNKFIADSEFTCSDTDFEIYTPSQEPAVHKTAITSQEHDPINNKIATPVLDVRSCLKNCFLGK